MVTQPQVRQTMHVGTPHSLNYNHEHGIKRPLLYIDDRYSVGTKPPKDEHYVPTGQTYRLLSLKYLFRLT